MIFFDQLSQDKKYIFLVDIMSVNLTKNWHSPKIIVSKHKTTLTSVNFSTLDFRELYVMFP